MAFLSFENDYLKKLNLFLKVKVAWYDYIKLSLIECFWVQLTKNQISFKRQINSKLINGCTVIELNVL